MSGTSLAPSSTVADPGTPDEGSPKTKRILLVAGDGFTRLVLLFRLRLAGFAVDFASNGVLGLGKLRTCHPDVLLVELRLSGLSGLELIKAARAEPTFGDRPVCVFTHAERMNRTTRQEAAKLATRVFDKTSVSREELVRTFVATFLKREPAEDQSPTNPKSEPHPVAPRENVPPGVIAAIIAGVREQTDLVIQEPGSRTAGGVELLGRVSSLASCAEEAGLPNLTRQAKALETFLEQLCGTTDGCTDPALDTVAQAVEVMSQLAVENTGEPQDLTRFTVVLVDEAPISNRALREALLTAGFEPVAFEEPARAREYLAANGTQLIVSNVRLPEAHGLGLADIRQLPGHAETPVIFGPELSRAEPLEEDLPTSSPQLNREPLLLAEVVVNALNAVQSPRTVTQTRRESFSQSQGAVPLSSPAPAEAPLLRFGDDFNLFAKPQNPQEAPSFTESSSPSELMGLTESEMPGADAEAEMLARLPATTFEGTHVDEPVAEEPCPPDLHLETDQLPQPEDTIENQVPTGSEPVPETANQDEIMNNPLQNQFAEPSWDQRQLGRHLAATAPEDGAFAEEQTKARCAELEQEIATLRQVVEDFNGSYGQQQQAADDTGKQVQDLEQNLNQAAAELEKEKAERQCVEAELLQQLKEAKSAREAIESARQQAEARSSQLEQELGSLRQAKDELANKLAEKQAAAQALEPAEGEEHEGQQDRQGVAALARATAELAKERGERQRSQQRAAELNERLQALHDDLKGMLQSQRADQERTGALEEEHRQAVLALDRRTADVEHHQAERELTEEKLQKANEANAQLRKDLSFFEEANKRFGGGRQELQARLEASLNAARENEARLRQEAAERQQLAERLEATQSELQDEARKREALEHELQAAQQTLQEREAKVQKEVAERQRLNEALRAVQGNAQDRSERDLELTKLQSNLELEQVERKRQETQLARIRHKAVDAAHAARALRTSLRRQIREPVDNLTQSARSLLELETSEEQKRLAEALLQDALLVQTRLREPELGQGDSTDSTDSPASLET